VSIYVALAWAVGTIVVLGAFGQSKWAWLIAGIILFVWWIRWAQNPNAQKTISKIGAFTRGGSQ